MPWQSLLSFPTFRKIANLFSFLRFATLRPRDEILFSNCENENLILLKRLNFIDFLLPKGRNYVNFSDFAYFIIHIKRLVAENLDYIFDVFIIEIG